MAPFIRGIVFAPLPEATIRTWTSRTFLDGVRGEPEFQALMAELRPRWEALVEWERDVLE